MTTIGVEANAPAWRPGRILQRPAWVRLGYILLFLLFWEEGARLYNDPLFMSPPSAVARAAVEILADRGVVRALEAAFAEVVAGFALSLVAGVAAGLLIGLNRIAYRGLFKIVLVLYGIPKVTIFPLILLYFGLGSGTKITFGFVHGVFPILVGVVAGDQNIDTLLLRAAAAMGAKRRHVLRWIIFPHLVPSLFTGMRLGMGGVLLGVILAELYVSALGIGYYTTRFSQGFQPAKLFALVGVLALMAIALNELMRRAELHFTRWKLAQRE
jgi:ABC-type nitrate/sulfonate/bicarbonate transport system permease component